MEETLHLLLLIVWLLVLGFTAFMTYAAGTVTKSIEDSIALVASVLLAFVLAFSFQEAVTHFLAWRSP